MAKTIDDQQKEIDMIHAFLERRKLEHSSSQSEKIIVHVNRDGTYQKTIEKTSPNSRVTVPANRTSKKR